jgi:chaperonin GroEL
METQDWEAPATASTAGGSFYDAIESAADFMAESPEFGGKTAKVGSILKDLDKVSSGPGRTYIGPSNVIGRDETQSKIKASLSAISSAVSATMGPFGSTTLIQDRTLQHYPTKDGYTVLKSLVLMEDIPRSILDIVTRVSRNLVRTVGDGSTSAVVVADRLYNSLSDMSNSKRITPRALVDSLGVLSTMLRRKIAEKARPIALDPNDHFSMAALFNVACVSTNNDPNAGKMVAELFLKVGPHGLVTVKEGYGVEDQIEISSGMEVGRGYVNALFAASAADKATVEYALPAMVFMCDDVLTEKDIPAIMNMVEDIVGKGVPLIFVCRGYDNYTRQMFQVNMQGSPGLQLCAIDIPVNSKAASEKFDDLALYLGAIPYAKLSGEDISKTGFDNSRLGMVGRFSCTDSSSKFIDGNGDQLKVKERTEHIIATAKKLSGLNDHVDRDGEIRALLARVASLNAKAATLWVGGAMDSERKARSFLLEDAVYAVKSAATHGYVTGGCLIVPTILREQREEMISELSTAVERARLLPKMGNEERNVFCARLIDCVDEAFLKSFCTVLENSGMDDSEAEQIAIECANTSRIYDVRTGKYEDNENGLINIVNSAETDSEIVKAAFSIIGQLITSNQFVTLNCR